MKTTLLVCIAGVFLASIVILTARRIRIRKLFKSIRQDRKEDVEQLLKRGVNPNSRLQHQGTALHAAAEKGFITCAEALLNNGADINAKLNPEGGNDDTPLAEAVLNHRKNMVDLLLSRGANPRAPMVLYYTAKWNVPHEICQSIITALGNVNAKDETYASTLLHYAAKHNNDSLVRELLAKGADPNLPDGSGTTPLGLSSIREITQLLLDHGCDANSKDHFGFTALHKVNSTEIVEVLMSHGANPNARNDWGWTPLHWATIMGLPGKTQRLLSNGAEVAPKDALDLAPLRWARALNRIGINRSRVIGVFRSEEDTSDRKFAERVAVSRPKGGSVGVGLLLPVKVVHPVANIVLCALEDFPKKQREGLYRVALNMINFLRSYVLGSEKDA